MAAAARVRTTIRESARALAHPRRALPVLIVSVPLVWEQARFGMDALAAPLGALMCVAAALVAPVAWQLAFPAAAEGADTRPRERALRLLAYATFSVAVVLLIGAALPLAFDMGPTPLTARMNLPIVAVLFLVAGWGLGRDIRLEATLVRETARAEALLREAQQAQLLAIQSHLDPHFLFNTLNAIAEWCREDPEVAERAILRLSTMLRVVLTGVRRATWSLEEELGLVDHVVALHLMRDPTAFTFQRGPIDPTLLALPVAPLILLPLAENAMKHGPARGHRGVVRLAVARDPANVNMIHITLENPGPYGGPRPDGVGLAMVEKRLALAAGASARLTIGEVAPASADAIGGPQTRVVLTLPAVMAS